MSKTTTFDIAVTFEPLTCCYADCGITFAVPAEFSALRQNDHKAWYCPTGHQQHFSAESEAEKLRRQLASANGNAAYYRERAEAEKRATAAQKGLKTRVLNRVKAGLCPFCGRRFDALGIHVQAAHADQVEAETETRDRRALGEESS